MDLHDFLGPKPTVIDLRAENRWEAIDELIDQLVAERKLKAENRGAIAESVKRREASMSTGIGFGIGIPHASTDLVSSVAGVIGRSRKGVQFDALDGKPVRFVMLFLVPQGQFQQNLHNLANIAKLLHNADIRDGLWGGSESIRLAARNCDSMTVSKAASLVRGGVIRFCRSLPNRWRAGAKPVGFARQNIPLRSRQIPGNQSPRQNRQSTFGALRCHLQRPSSKC
jgi:mannitol/fructose-specific phosphotransferase system IIA component (Ntr-type)